MKNRVTSQTCTNQKWTMLVSEWWKNQNSQTLHPMIKIFQGKIWISLVNNITRNLCDNYVPQWWVEFDDDLVGCLPTDAEIFILFCRKKLNPSQNFCYSDSLLTFIYLVRAWVRNLKLRVPISIKNLRICGCQRWCSELPRVPGTHGTRANSEIS